MSNRNFDASTIINILKAQTAGNNSNRSQTLTNTDADQVAKNPQTVYYDASVIPIIDAGSQSYYLKGYPNTIILPPQQFTVYSPAAPPPPPPKYNTIVYFRDVGAFSWTAPGTEGPFVLNYIIVGGGGGAGGSAYASCGGGGGGGEVSMAEFYGVAGTTYTGIVGYGGAGGEGIWNGVDEYGDTLDGLPGGVTDFGGVVVQGGSGGKKAEYFGAGTQAGGQTTIGGGGGNGPPSENGGGGGGGGRLPGSNGSGPIGGTGGSGIGNDINTDIYGAGGAGGTIIPPATDLGGASGAPNTGNGGDALNVSINFPVTPLYSGSGGSGIVILAYNV